MTKYVECMMSNGQKLAMAGAVFSVLWACGGNAVEQIGEEPDTPMSDMPDGPEPSVASSIATRLSVTSVRAGDKVDIYCDVLDQRGDIIEYDVSEEAPAIQISMNQPGAMELVQDHTYEAHVAGMVTVTCTGSFTQNTTAATVEIVPGDPFAVTTYAPQNSLFAGEDITVSCDVVDAYENIVDVQPSLATSPMGDGVIVDQLNATITRSGTYSLSCEVPGAQHTEPVEVEVFAAMPANLTIAKSPEQAVYALDQVIAVESMVTDRYDNIVVDPTISFSSFPLGGDEFSSGRFRYLSEGSYTITARVDSPTDNNLELSQSIEVFINSNGPSIQCVFPSDGEMLNTQIGNNITLRGSLQDANGLSEVFIGGQAASIANDGSFEIPHKITYGMNFVDIIARDALGEENSRTCAFLAAENWTPEGQFLNDAVAFKLTQNAMDDFNNDDGLDSLSDIMLQVLNSSGLKETLHSTLLSQNPLRDRCEQKVFGACIFRLKLNYQEIKIKGPNDVEIQLVDGGWRLIATVKNIEAKVKISGTLKTSGWAKFRSISVDLTSDLGLNANGAPSVSVRKINAVNVGSIDLDFGGIAGFIIDIIEGLFEGKLRDLMKDTVRDFIDGEFNAVLDGLVSNLDVNVLGSNFNVPRLDGNGSIEVGFGLDFTSIHTDASRSLFGIGTRFSGPVTRADSTLGSPIPSGPALFDPSTNKSAAVAIHVGILNNVLHVLWRAGFFDIALNGPDLSSDLPPELTLNLDTNLPPIAVLTSEETVQVHLGAINLAVLYPDVLEEALEVTIGAVANAEIALDGNELRFDNIQVEAIYFSTPNVSLDEESRAELEDLLHGLLQQLVNESLNNALPALPIPRFNMPAEIGKYGLPYPSSLGIDTPEFSHNTKHFSLDGNFGFQ